MNRLREWFSNETATFWLITAGICLVVGLGGYFGGRLWVNHYMAKREADTPGLGQTQNGAPAQPGQPGQPGQTDQQGTQTGANWSQSPSVVLRERQPSAAERQGGGAPTELPPGPGADTTQPAAGDKTSPDTSTATPSETQPSTSSPSGADTGSPSTPSPDASASTGGQWTATAGSYRDRRNADQVAESLNSQGLTATVEKTTVGGKTTYRVNAGTFATRDEASAAGEKVRSAGYPSRVKRAD